MHSWKSTIARTSCACSISPGVVVGNCIGGDGSKLPTSHHLDARHSSW